MLIVFVLLFLFLWILLFCLFCLFWGFFNLFFILLLLPMLMAFELLLGGGSCVFLVCVFHFFFSFEAVIR